VTVRYFPALSKIVYALFSSDMNTKKYTILFVFISLLIFSVISKLFFNDFQNGWEAYLKKDYKKAHDLWLPLANQGDSKAQFFLGLMYDFGFGFPEDDKKAINWYQLAAAQGDSRAIDAENGIIEGQYSLAAFNLAKKNVSVALNILRGNAEHGDMQAQYYLAEMYSSGQGITRNDVLAYMWFRLSALQQYKDAELKINLLKVDMSPQQIEIAKKKVIDWKIKK
jgi:uncharacterized protein